MHYIHVELSPKMMVIKHDFGYIMVEITVILRILFDEGKCRQLNRMNIPLTKVFVLPQREKVNGGINEYWV